MTRRSGFLLVLALTGCGELTEPIKLAELRQVSSGTDHSCAVGNGGVACWGSNDQSQLGGPGGATTEPVLAHLRPLDIVAVAAGNQATCGRTSAGDVLCWGSNSGPSQPEGLPPVATLTASGAGCGTTQSGNAWCWTLPAGRAIRIEGGPYRVTVAGIEQNCALASDSTASCWAQGSATPAAVPGGHHFSHLAVGRAHACGIDGDGGIWCWGANNRGQLGDNSTTPRSTPVSLFATGLPANPSFIGLTAGSEHTCAILAGGAAYCWGRDNSGQTGNGGPPPTSNNYWAGPVAVAGGKSWRSLSAGSSHTCGITDDGVPFCWGGNDRGQLGIGNRELTTEPTEVVWSF